MFDAIMEWLVEYIRNIGGLGVLLGVLLETFIAPIPSPLIPTAAGFILVPLEATYQEAFMISFSTIALFGSFGATAGAFFGYAIGRYGGRPFIDKYGRYLGITWDDIKKLEERLGRNNVKDAALVLARAAPIIPLSPVSFLSGFIHFSILKFALLTFLGCLPRYFALGIVGWWTGIAYAEFVEAIGFMEDLILILLVIGVIGLLVFYKLKVKNKASSSSEY